MTKRKKKTKLDDYPFIMEISERECFQHNLIFPLKSSFSRSLTPLLVMCLTGLI